MNSSSYPMRSQIIVNTVVSSLSLIGGASIVIGYYVNLYKGGEAKLRQRLVLGLGVVDTIQALVVLIGNALNLGGQRYAANSHGCNASAFIYQTCVVVSAGWTLCIALLTFVTLVHPRSRFSQLTEHRLSSLVIWTIVWVAGLLPAIFGVIFFNSIDNGGVCWYEPNSLQSKLMLFVPRAVALVAVIVLYTLLFIFFRRRDINLLHYASSGTGTVSDEEETSTSAGRRLSTSLQRVGTKLAHWNPTSRRESSASQAPRGNNPQQSQMKEHQPVSFRPSFGRPPSSDFGATPIGGNSRRPSAIQISIPAEHQHRDRTDSLTPINGNSLDFTDSGASTTDLPENSKSDRTSPPEFHHDSNLLAPKNGSGGGGDPTFCEFLAEERRGSNTSTIGGGAGLESGGGKRGKKLSPRQINRRLSLLMMLYPIAYLILFSVSVGRLAQSIATNRPASATLTHVSRWLVYGQGLVDGILYFVIEYLFRRSTRGRT